MMIKSEFENKITKKLQAHPINDEMAVFQLEICHSINGKINSKVQEGIANISTLIKWDGQDEKLHNGFTFVDPIAIEKYKKYGMCTLKFKSQDWDSEAFHKLTVKHPFTAFINNELKEKCVARLHSYDHVLILADGTVVSKPIVFDCGVIDNSHYDLEKVAQILSQRQDIIFIKNKEILHAPLKESYQVIEKIPYAPENGKNKTIAFMLILPQEDFNKMRKELGKLSEHEYIAKNNLAGIEDARLILKKRPKI